MISGGWKTRAGLLALALSFAGFAAEVPSPALSLPGLFEKLAANHDTRARFVEIKHMSVLSRPLRLEGTLEFRKPDFLAKHVEKPAREDYLIEGGKVTVEKPAEGSRVELALADHPPLAAFAASLRAPLAGDLPALTRYWKPSLGGSVKHWRLALVPVDPELAKIVRSVQLEGREDRLTGMAVEEAGGDSSTIRLEPLTAHPSAR
jgi:hypothetical protein